MDNKMKTGIALAAAFGLPALAIAGPEAPPIEAPASNPGDWCTWLQNKPGTLYKNKENPFLQEFQIEGRFQYQYGHVEGDDLNGTDYDEDYDEVRRFRLGVKAKFLQYFGLKYQVNLVNDNRPSGGDLDWGYEDIDEAYVSFDLAKAFGNTGFEELSMKYGRQKFLLGTEAHLSSTKLLTIERSAISNKVYGSYRPTGLTLEGLRARYPSQHPFTAPPPMELTTASSTAGRTATPCCSTSATRYQTSSSSVAISPITKASLPTRIPLWTTSGRWHSARNTTPASGV